MGCVAGRDRARFKETRACACACSPAHSSDAPHTVIDPFSSVLAGLFVGVAVAAAWGHIARPPSLDGERWFKVLLASLLRGRSEQEGEDAETWASTVVQCVPYHPAGREPESKVSSPSTWRPAHLLQEGEAALMEQLTGLETKAQRWQHLYQGAEEGLHARLSDPMDLGPDYDLGRRAGKEWVEIGRASCRERV